MATKKRWIQKAVAGMRKDKPCTGAKFGSSSCPPGSKRYNLAVTFRKIARKRKADGGEVSSKISYLVNQEKIPQKQAVAIALDMQRRGKLQDGGTVEKKKVETTYGTKYKDFDDAWQEAVKRSFAKSQKSGWSQGPAFYFDVIALPDVKGNSTDKETARKRWKEKYEKEAISEFKHGGKIPEWLYDARGKAMRRRMRREIKYKDNISKYSHGGTALTGFASGAATGAITGGAAGGIGALPGAIIGGAAGAIGGYIKGRGAHKAMDKEQEMREQELLRQQLEDQKQEELLKQSRINYQAAQQEPLISNQFSQPNVIYNFENIEEIESPYKDYAKDVTAGMYVKHGGNINLSRYHNLPQEEYDKAVINVEKDELEVSQGKVITDYKAKPRHPKNEAEIDSYGNTLAKPGNIIIPRDKREAYLKGDKITRNTIEAQLRRDQSKREREELGELRGRSQYLKSLSENVRRHISATGQTPVEGSSPSIFPPGYSVGLKDLNLYRHGGNVSNLNAEDYSNLFYGQGGCVGCGFRDGGSVLPDFLYQARGRAMKKANPEYFKHGGKIRYQDGSIVEKAPAYEDEFGYQNFLNSQLADYYGKSQAAPGQRDILPYMQTLDYTSLPSSGRQLEPYVPPSVANYSKNGTKTSPLGVSDFGGVSDTGNRFGFSDFAQYAAPLYNIGMGLFGKTPQAEAIQNPYASQVKDIMSRRRISMGPVYEGIGLASAGTTRQLRGLTGGSAGLQLQGMQNIQNIEARNRANAVMQEQIANMGFRGEEASMLAGTLGPQEMAAAERQRQLQYAMEANQAQYLPAGISQLGTIPQYKSRDELLKRLLREKGITV